MRTICWIELVGIPPFLSIHHGSEHVHLILGFGVVVGRPKERFSPVFPSFSQFGESFHSRRKRQQFCSVVFFEAGSVDGRGVPFAVSSFSFDLLVDDLGPDDGHVALPQLAASVLERFVDFRRRREKVFDEVGDGGRATFRPAVGAALEGRETSGEGTREKSVAVSSEV